MPHMHPGPLILKLRPLQPYRLYCATMRLQSGQVRRDLMEATPSVLAPLLMSSSAMFCHPDSRDTCVGAGGRVCIRCVLAGGGAALDEQLGDASRTAATPVWVQVGLHG